MARWKPGAPNRLQQAAMELFVDPGYESATVAQIASRAGVTERTFFRHFADKREVLFAGEKELLATFVAAITDAPDASSPLELVTAALDAAGDTLQRHRGRDHARVRARIIAANPPLQERELLKLTTLSQEIGQALVRRGSGALAARLAGELAVSVFGTAYSRWVADGETRDLVELQREALAALRALARD